MASFPGAVASFTTKSDTTDVIYAAHINALQDEIVAIQNTIGNSSLKTSSWTSTPFAQTSTWTTLNDRLNNIEHGLLAYGALAPHPLLLAGM